MIDPDLQLSYEYIKEACIMMVFFLLKSIISLVKTDIDKSKDALLKSQKSKEVS